MSDQDPVQKLQASVDRIERALVGDEKMGQFGLVSRANNHAHRIKRLEQLAALIIAGSAVLGFVYKVATDWRH